MFRDFYDLTSFFQLNQPVCRLLSAARLSYHLSAVHQGTLSIRLVHQFGIKKISSDSFVFTHIPPEETLMFQNMQQTKKLDNTSHQSSQGAGKNLDSAKLPWGV